MVKRGGPQQARGSKSAESRISVTHRLSKLSPAHLMPLPWRRASAISPGTLAP